MIKAFRDWKFEEVQRTFGLHRVFEHPLLDTLLQAQHQPSPKDQDTIEELRQELLYTIDTPSMKKNSKYTSLVLCYALSLFVRRAADLSWIVRCTLLMAMGLKQAAR